MSDKKIRIRFETSKQDLEEEQAVAAASSEEFVVEKSEPVSAPQGSPIARSHFVGAVVGTVATTVAYIAKRLFDKWQKNKQEGMTIDLRERPPLISRISGAPEGFLIVIDPEGKAKTHLLRYKNEAEATNLLSGILG